MKFASATEALTKIVKGAQLSAISDALNSEVFLVGGSVRDALLELPEGGDFDLAVKLPPEEIQTRIQAAGIHVIPTGLKHQTVTAVFEEPKLHVEITSFRGPGMSPEGGVVMGADIVEDLSLRDFTVNAIAFSFKTLTLIDPMDGVRDLDARILRACGVPEERFAEDPLRALRGVRMAASFDLTIESATAEAIRNFGPRLAKVSVERIRDEIEKILLSKNPRMGFELLEEFGLLEWTIPELIPSVKCEQNRFHPQDVYNHTLDVVENSRPDLLLRLSALFHDIGKPHTISIDEVTGDRHFFKHETVGAEITVDAMKRLRFSNELIDATAMLVRTHMRPTNAGAPGLRRLLRDTGPYYNTWRELKEADTLATNIDKEEFAAHIKDFDERIEEIKKGPELSPLSSLALRGSDLLALGIKEGPKIGVILRSLHERVLDNPELNTKETLSEIVKNEYLAGR